MIGVPFSLAFIVRRPGGASRVERDAPSIVTSSSVHEVFVTLSRTMTAPAESARRSTVTVRAEGFAFGSGGGISASRSEKSNSVSVSRTTCTHGVVRVKLATRR